MSEAFADKLGLRKKRFQDGKSTKVRLGNSEMFTPMAGVEFSVTKDTEYSQYSNYPPRRKISALVLRNLPTTVLMLGNDLINLGLLPPAWPNHGEGWSAGAGETLNTNFPADRNMTEK